MLIFIKSQNLKIKTNNMFAKIKNFFIKNKSTIFKVILFLWLYIYFSDFTFATNENTNVLDTKTKNKIVEWISWITTTISVFLWLLTYLVTIFLSPEWISWNIFWISDTLKQVWILISNVVYFVFAFILIYIAFMNIIGSWWQDYEFKSALPKFIVWILIVPLSWFIVQFVIGLSSILTISALNLPFETFKNYQSQISTVEIPTSCSINFSSLANSDWKTSTEWNSKTNKIFSCEEEGWKITGKKLTLDEVLKSDKASDGIFWIMSLYTYWLLDLGSISALKTDTLNNTIKTIWDVVVYVVFNLIFVVAYALLMIALWLALMIRWVRLWIYAMLSPLFWLMYFFWKWKEWFFEKFNLVEFFHLAMVPVYTMLALSFWMLLIFQTWQGLSSWNSWSIWWDILKAEKGKNDDTKLVLNGKFNLIIEWWIPKESHMLWNIFKTTADTGLWIIWVLILKIFWIIILWWTVMMALSKSEITKTMVEPIASFWSQVWKLAQSLPQYTPILPGGQSLQSLWQIPWIMRWQLDKRVSEQTTRFSEFAGFTKSEFLQALESLNSNPNILKNQDWQAKVLKQIVDLYKADPQRALQDKNFQELVKKYNDSSVSKKLDFSDKTKFIKSVYDSNNSLGNSKNLEFMSPDGVNSYISWISATPPWETTWTQTWNNITINVANKQINLPGNENFSFSWNAKDVNSISSEIRRWLWNNTISKTELFSKLKEIGIEDNTINEIISKLWDKVEQ